MAAAAGGERLSFDSALAATLQDLKLTFSLRKEQRTALKSFLEKKYVFVVLINYIVKAVALTTSPSSLLWLVVALSYCVQRELERQPFIPPTLPMEQRQTRHLSDVGLACQAIELLLRVANRAGLYIVYWGKLVVFFTIPLLAIFSILLGALNLIKNKNIENCVALN